MLQTIDLNQSLSRKVYKKELLRAQLQLRQLAYQLYVNKRSLVVVYEGVDAAGKSSNIKHITERLDPRGYEVYSIAPPESDERTYHYLWRFWRCLMPPEKKQFLIFNRSWYRRVLDERVEEIYPKSVWRRAYREINEFERQLADFDIIIAKFWLHISLEEQLQRFAARAPWKLTPKTWDTRVTWELYEEAVEDMLLRTSTVPAPWTVIESDDKYYSRVKATQTLVELLTRELNYQPEDLLLNSQDALTGKLHGLFEQTPNGESLQSSLPDVPHPPVI